MFGSIQCSDDCRCRCMYPAIMRTHTHTHTHTLYSQVAIKVIPKSKVYSWSKVSSVCVCVLDNSCYDLMTIVVCYARSGLLKPSIARCVVADSQCSVEVCGVCDFVFGGMEQ